MSEGRNKSALAQALGVSRASLYYHHRKPAKDWTLKVRIEEILREQPSYGSRRIAQTLGVSRPRAQRVMRLFGLKPYRRRGRKWKKPRKLRVFPNLLLVTMPRYQHHVWASDFTEISHHRKKVYVATVIDLFTREVVGLQIGLRKGSALTIQALSQALFHHPRPTIFHSDNGKEYEAHAFMDVLEEYGVAISRSRPGCPWENGYQESFYDKFKVELGDPNRCNTLGELVAEIYRIVWIYNHTRIHSALSMPPVRYAEYIKQKTAILAA